MAVCLSQKCNKCTIFKSYHVFMCHNQHLLVEKRNNNKVNMSEIPLKRLNKVEGIEQEGPRT